MHNLQPPDIQTLVIEPLKLKTKIIWMVSKSSVYNLAARLITKYKFIDSYYLPMSCYLFKVRSLKKLSDHFI